MAHGLQMAEIAQYKKRKAEKQQQEQLAKKKNWGNVMHYKKMYNITRMGRNINLSQSDTLAWTVSTCRWSLFAFGWIWPRKMEPATAGSGW